MEKAIRDHRGSYVLDIPSERAPVPDICSQEYQGVPGILWIAKYDTDGTIDPHSHPPYLSQLIKAGRLQAEISHIFISY